MLRISFIVLISIASTAVQAEQALMRLFYSPAERALIDLKKQQKTAESPVTTESQVLTEKIEAKGYLKQQGKTPVVWINESNTLKSTKVLSDVKVKGLQQSGTIKVVVQGKGTVKLKPGQVVTRSNDGVTDVYQTKK